jgi:preprotein translocase subunit YajC
MLISDVFAQDTAPASATVASTEALTPAPYELSQEKMFKDTMMFLVFLFFIFYFMLIRPQQKRFKEHQIVLKSLQKGDEVVTGGGLIGKIHKFEGDDVVVIELAENVRVKVARSSISEKYREPSRQTSVKDAKDIANKTTANDN